MTLLNLILLSLTLSCSIVSNAEVFKCKSSTGKIFYQPNPCGSGAAIAGVIKEKIMSPEEVDAAKTKLQAWQQQQDAEEAAKIQAEKERQAEYERQEIIALQRRSVLAQEQQAIAAQQRQYQSVGFGYYPYNRHYFPGYQPRPNWIPQEPHHEHHHDVRNETPPAPMKLNQSPQNAGGPPSSKSPD